MCKGKSSSKPSLLCSMFVGVYLPPVGTLRIPWGHWVLCILKSFHAMISQTLFEYPYQGYICTLPGSFPKTWIVFQPIIFQGKTLVFGENMWYSDTSTSQNDPHVGVLNIWQAPSVTHFNHWFFSTPGAFHQVLDWGFDPNLRSVFFPFWYGGKPLIGVPYVCWFGGGLYQPTPVKKDRGTSATIGSETAMGFVSWIAWIPKFRRSCAQGPNWTTHRPTYLEDRPVTCKWLITMVIVRSPNMGLFPFQTAEMQVTNHLLAGVILQVGPPK